MNDITNMQPITDRDIKRAIAILKSTVEYGSLCTPGANRSEILALVARLEARVLRRAASAPIAELPTTAPVPKFRVGDSVEAKGDSEPFVVVGFRDYGRRLGWEYYLSGPRRRRSAFEGELTRR